MAAVTVVVVVGKENQGIRMSYILMIMHERVAGIMKVGQIDSYTFAIARFCVYLLLNRGHDIAPNCNIFVWLISLPPVLPLIAVCPCISRAIF